MTVSMPTISPSVICAGCKVTVLVSEYLGAKTLPKQWFIHRRDLYCSTTCVDKRLAEDAYVHGRNNGTILCPYCDGGHTPSMGCY